MRARTRTWLGVSLGLALIGGMGLSGPWGAARAAAGTPRASEESVRDLVFFAVLEGLYRDGVSNESVDIILAREEVDEGERYTHFIYGCPLCQPALNAFLVYRQRPAFYAWKGLADTFGPGLPDGERAGLGSPDMATRLEVLNVLIERWVKARLDRSRPTAEERETWSRQLEASRKKGMAILQESQQAGLAGSYAGMKGCAVCDAANEACEPR